MPTTKSFQILAIISAQNTIYTLQKLLQDTSFDLRLALNAEEGLQKAEEILPDAILIDIELADDAFGTCRRLRANKVLRGMPILMLCDVGDIDAKILGISAGVDDYISKPFDEIEVLSRLRTITRLNAKRGMVNDLTRFTWMADHATDGYLLLDKSGVIHYANEHAHTLLNLPEDYLGLPFINVTEYRFTAEPEEAWANWLNDPVPCFLVQPESPTARAAWVMVDALDTLLGTEQHRIVRLKDVTERMSIYQDMRRFHTVVAHKLRTPVSMLVSSISLLKTRMDQLSEEDLRDLLKSGIKGVDRLATQMQEILTYIDAPLALNIGVAVTLEKVPEMVRTICQPLKLSNIVLSIPENLLPQKIALTYEALESILYELLANSRKFHPENKPTVEVSVNQIDDDYIQLRVADNGQSLSTEQLAWVWIPYVQGEKDITGELPGMGLGFPMIASLIWKAGGDLRLRNRHDGPGVIVELKIPFESTAREFERPAAPYPG